jgi:pimeloyl-ACP methyl ester carboxylesterase
MAETAESHLEGDLPDGLRGRFVDGVNGLRMHVLEAGEASRPVLLLLHGFPELAYSWRKVMPALAAAGYHVIAPDQRGYGGTTGWDPAYDTDLDPFRQMRLAGDMVALLGVLDLAQVQAVIGHDFGSPVAAHCALLRPDVFPRVAMMSAPFAGPPPSAPRAAPASDIHADLAALLRPRKLYQWYYSTPQADPDMLGAPQGLRDFLRAYYHAKSADWPGNRPHRLERWAAEALAVLPDYYVMPFAATMPRAVEAEMPSAAQVAACEWLPDNELAVYADEFGRTGFQGGLNWYRAVTAGLVEADLRAFAGRQIEVPALFITGAADWGAYQTPGALEAMQIRACRDFRGVRVIDGAGHWVQQEQPGAVIDALLAFL